MVVLVFFLFVVCLVVHQRGCLKAAGGDLRLWWEPWEMCSCRWLLHSMQMHSVAGMTAIVCALLLWTVVVQH